MHITVVPGRRADHTSFQGAPSAGFEPAHTAPEADALSPELRGRDVAGYPPEAGRHRGRHGRLSVPMADPLELLADRLRPAFEVVGGRPGVDPVVRSSEHADAQANGALPLAKALGRPPREVAQAVLDAADLSGLATTVEIAGPGFVNVTFDPAWIADAHRGRRGRRPAGRGRGGRARARRRRLLGAECGQGDAHRPSPYHRHRRCAGPRARIPRPRRGPREPHRRLGPSVRHAHRAPRRRRRRARRVARHRRPRRVLQGGDDQVRRRRRVPPSGRGNGSCSCRTGTRRRCALWRPLVAQSATHWNEVYVKLGVLLTDDDLAGESRYEALMPEVIERLDRRRPARGVRRRPGRVPAGVHQPGGRAVAADRAQSRRRLHLRAPATWRASSTGSSGSAATRLLYVVDAGQAQHCAMVFAVAAMAGWLVPPGRGRARRVRPRARDRPQAAAQPQRRAGPVHRRRRRGDRAWPGGRSPRRTPTCRPSSGRRSATPWGSGR